MEYLKKHGHALNIRLAHLSCQVDTIGIIADSVFLQWVAAPRVTLILQSIMQADKREGTIY
jgi:hypothetical protein